MSKKPFFSPEDMARLRAITMEELAEIDERVVTALERLKENPGDIERYKDILIGFHTVGGSAGLVGLTEISRLGIETESFVRKIISGQAEPGADAIATIAAAREKLLELKKDPK
jgi:chemotaxis protein histidine kinase CheA